ncbi:MAG: GNAT family N-acetyltransferase [Acidobacteriota bacterium]|nr:GNAT family N-acetyltransferase [Acidobacteriota bacterium]
MTLATRRGELSDLHELLRLRAVMFRDMGHDVTATEWLDEAKSALERGLRSGTIIAAVVDHESSLVAGGLLQIFDRLATPHFPRGTFGYLGSIVVDEPHRRRGLGTQIVGALVEEARHLGLERVELHATKNGEGLYRSFGFRERGGGLEMRLELGR